MRLLIAEDDLLFSHALKRLLSSEYEVVLARDGALAWKALQQEDAPRLVVLDWMMPGLDGLEVCRRIRETPRLQPTYVLLLTAKHSIADIVTGLESGADDYITKPFEPQELRARVRVGQRVLELQMAYADRVRELQEALARVKQLQGLVPICSYCKRIRDDRNYWQQLETYISKHSEATFTHGLCPECYEKFVRPEIEGGGPSR